MVIGNIVVARPKLLRIISLRLILLQASKFPTHTFTDALRRHKIIVSEMGSTITSVVNSDNQNVRIEYISFTVQSKGAR